MPTETESTPLDRIIEEDASVEYPNNSFSSGLASVQYSDNIFNSALVQ